MGEFLSKPSTEKNATDGKNHEVKWGACSMQGWRRSNEDAHITEMDIGDGNGIYAVFDGHGGQWVAKFCEVYFQEYLMANSNYIKGDYKTALEETFVELDHLLVNDEGYNMMKELVLKNKQKVKGDAAKLEPEEERNVRAIPFNSGCTSCVCIMTKDQIICANSGDSRACIVNKDGSVIELSHDHKPERDCEIKRIKAAGGYVEDGRVQGVIAVSRAIGDWEYKNSNLLKENEKKLKKAMKSKNPQVDKTGPYRQILTNQKYKVTSFPDIIQVPKSQDHDFFIVACDGIWDCFSNQQCADFIRNTRERGPKSNKPIKLRLQRKATNGKDGYPGKPMSTVKYTIQPYKHKVNKPPGETSYIISELMDTGLAKDITSGDGLGTDNMTCIIIKFIREEEEEVKRNTSLQDINF